MIHRYKRDAAEELLAAVKYYEDAHPGLGAQFLDEVDAAITKVKDAPMSWPQAHGGARRYRLDRFPYQIVYETKYHAIAIVAVAHLHRKPGDWKDRIK